MQLPFSTPAYSSTTSAGANSAFFGSARAFSIAYIKRFCFSYIIHPDRKMLAVIPTTGTRWETLTLDLKLVLFNKTRPLHQAFGPSPSHSTNNLPIFNQVPRLNNLKKKYYCNFFRGTFD